MVQPYYEKMQQLTHPSLGWQDIDLTSYGPSDEDICDLVGVHDKSNDSSAYGFRKDASSIDRRFIVREAEGGGVITLGMQAVCDGANARIEAYRSHDSNDEKHFLLGYWAGQGTNDYAEAKENIQATGNGAWETITFPSATASSLIEVLCSHSDQVNEITLGVREIGSSLDRKFDVTKAESAGSGTEYNCYICHVWLDASKQCQVYTTDYTVTYFTRFGEWSTMPSTYYYEKNEALSLTEGSWNSLGMGTYGAVAGDVVEILAYNIEDNVDNLMGVRTGGSSLVRYFDVEEGEGGGGCFVRYLTKTDASNNIEYYVEEDTYCFMKLVGVFSDTVPSELNHLNFERGIMRGTGRGIARGVC